MEAYKGGWELIEMRLEIRLIELFGIDEGDVIVGDVVSEAAAATPLAASAALLAGGFDAEDDETILTGELLLRQDAVVEQRRGHAQVFRLARRPRVAVGQHVALAVEPGAVPHDLLRPHDVVQDVAVVEAVDVVLHVVEHAALPLEQVVPRTEQHFSLQNHFINKKKKKIQ